MAWKIALVGLLLATGCVVFAPHAQADTYDLAPPGPFLPGTYGSGIGSRRSFIFEDTGAFDLDSVSIEVDPDGTTQFTAQLWTITGADTLVSLVTTNSALLADVGRDWYTVALDNLFSGSGDRYLLDIQWNRAPVAFQYYDFEGLNDFGMGFDPAYTVGPIKVIDGRGPTSINSPNFVLAHFKVDGNANPVPEPGTLGLLGVGVLGLAFARSRRRK